MARHALKTYRRATFSFKVIFSSDFLMWTKHRIKFLKQYIFLKKSVAILRELEDEH